MISADDLILSWPVKGRSDENSRARPYVHGNVVCDPGTASHFAQDKLPFYRAENRGRVVLVRTRSVIKMQAPCKLIHCHR